MDKKKIYSALKDYLMIVLGLLIYVFGYTAFIIPNEIVTGGVTGLATLFGYGLHWNIAVTYYAINAILLAIAFRTLGKRFVIRTIFGATVCSLLIGIMQPIFAKPLVPDQPFMNAIIGAVLAAVGIGTVFTNNGSSAGTDIIAAMVTKHTNVSFGRMMLYCDLCIIGSSWFIFKSVETIVYGLVFLIIFSIVVDMVINNNRQAVQFFILSKHWDQIADTINSELHRGCTVLTGMGWYSKHDVKVLMVMCRRFESTHIFRIVKLIDPEAFISRTNVSGVYGRGFDEMKVRIKADHEHHENTPGHSEGTPSDQPTDSPIELPQPMV